MRKLKTLLTILSLLGIIIGCTEATTTEVITNDKKPEYKISFNANGGKGQMSDIKIVAETSIILPENTFTRDNYTFMGWATTADGKVMFENGAIFEGLYSNVTLYAKWEKEVVPVVKITITFDVNGAGGTVPTAIETTPDENVELPVLTNAKFSHWNTKSDGSGHSYKTTATFTESVTLYAILLAENAHTITYELDGGVNNTVNPSSFTEDEAVILREPTKDGYKFVGWYETADFSGSVVKGWFAGDKTENVTLYAKWEKEATPVVKITITFDVNGAGGTVPTAIETTPDENVNLPVLTNAKFSHWNTSPNGSGQSYKDSAIFTESVTLYAILLAENAHTITYELNGGVNHPKNKYSFTEDDAVILREPTRENCIFVGWYETADFSGEKIELWYEGDKTANVTLYAKWRSVIYDTTPVFGKSESFIGGFKFTTEEGWDCQYTSANASPSPVNRVYARLNGEPAAMATIAKNKYVSDQFNDESTRIYVDKDELEPEKLYTLTYDLKNGTVKLTEAADGAKETSTECQIADEEGKFPKGVYINGYLSKFWGGTNSPINDDNKEQYSLLMDVVSEEDEVYAFTWKAPAGTVTVTLKITMTEDTANDTAAESVLYLRDCPVKTDGTSVINGSIYGWPGDGGTPVTIKNEDGSRITGGILDAAMTAKGNAAWALTNYVNGNKDVNLSEKFRMEGADDVLQLLIDVEMWVPYVKGKVATYSWKDAQNKLKAPDEEADKME